MTNDGSAAIIIRVDSREERWRWKVLAHTLGKKSVNALVRDVIRPLLSEHLGPKPEQEVTTKTTSVGA